MRDATTIAAVSSSTAHRLVRRGERDRHDEEQGRDAEHHLQRGGRRKQRVERDASRISAEFGAQARRPEQQHTLPAVASSERPVVELHGRYIFEPIQKNG